MSYSDPDLINQLSFKPSPAATGSSLWNAKILYRKKELNKLFLYLPENYRYLQRVTI